MRYKIQAGVLVLALTMMGGCVRVQIGDAVPTLGEQLIELYRAKERGAITDAEFDELERRLIDSLH